MMKRPNGRLKLSPDSGFMSRKKELKMTKINDFVTLKNSKKKWKVVGLQPPLPVVEAGILLILRNGKTSKKINESEIELWKK